MTPQIDRSFFIVIMSRLKKLSHDEKKENPSLLSFLHLSAAFARSQPCWLVFSVPPADLFPGLITVRVIKEFLTTQSSKLIIEPIKRSMRLG